MLHSRISFSRSMRSVRSYFLFRFQSKRLHCCLVPREVISEHSYIQFLWYPSPPVDWWNKILPYSLRFLESPEWWYENPGGNHYVQGNPLTWCMALLSPVARKAVHLSRLAEWGLALHVSLLPSLVCFCTSLCLYY